MNAAFDADVLLERGIVRSERLRSGLLLSLLGLVLLIIGAFLLSPGHFRGVVAPELEAPLRRIAPFILLGALAMAVVEAGLMVWLWRRKERLSFRLRLVQITLEIGLVGVLLALSVHVIGPVQSFAGPVTFLFFPVIALSALNLDWRLSLWSGVVAAVGFMAVFLLHLPQAVPVEGYPMLTSFHQFVLKAILLVFSGAASAFVAVLMRRQLGEAIAATRERDAAVSIFGQHVSPQVANRLLKQAPQSFGEEREVCVMFLDIRNFSVFAAERTPSEVMAYLNSLFVGLIDLVNEHGGIVNKFLGDGFMAVFGAPEGDEKVCRNAVRCSKALLAEVQRLNESHRIPPTRIGIGLHAGPALTGVVGSDARREYTVIGDTVNLAARIEQATKPLECDLLISEAVWSVLREEDRDGGVDRGLADLKGQSKPARLFQLG